MAKQKVNAAEQLKQLCDAELGPLAEAIALADVLDTIALDKIGMRDHVEIVLCRMLCQRLDQVRSIIDAGVAHG